MIRGIIFDLDGTLISERKYILSCLENAGAYIERTYGDKETYSKLKSLFEAKWEKVFDRYFEQEKISYTEDDIRNLVKVYRETEPAVTLYPDVTETLKSLSVKGIKLALLTNGYYEIQKKKIEKAHLEQFFDLIVIPDKIGRHCWKPSEWGYDLILNEFGIPPEELLSIGDMNHDFIVPQLKGMKCTYIERDDRMKDLDTEIEIHSKINSLKELEKRL